MIIFYQKSTGKILGTIVGRVNTDNHRKMSIKPADVDSDDIGKWEVPLKAVKEVVEEPIVELRVTDLDTLKVQKVQTGTREVERVKEMIFDHEQSDLLHRIESGKENIYDYILDVKNTKTKTLLKSE